MGRYTIGSPRSIVRFISGCLMVIYVCVPNVSAITCSICGQSNLTAPGECANQFQYDCLSNVANGGGGHQSPSSGQRQAKILCRTTRTKLGENLFAVVKECVTETEHLNRYPEGKAFGCETVQTNSSFPITYCVCDQDLCNVRSIDEQLLDQSQPPPGLAVNGHPTQEAQQLAEGASPPQPPPSQPTGRQNAVGNQSNRTRPVENVQPQQPIPEQLQNARGLPLAGSQQQQQQQQQQQRPFIPPLPPVDGQDTDPSQQLPPGPGLIEEPPPPADQPARSSAIAAQSSPQSNSPSKAAAQQALGTTPQVLVQLNTERVEFLPELNKSSSKTPGGGFACMVCAEGNLSQSQDCQIQNPLECRNLFRPGANLFCFTKAITLPTGQAQIEKRCASEEQLVQELGIASVQPSCFSGQDGHVRVDYCVCGTTKCNQMPISNQANMYPPLTNTDRVKAPAGPPNPQQPLQNPGANVGASAGQQSKMCYVCGESDQSEPSDCSQQYEYDCGKQYPQGATILCLTRQTKVASGRYNIEKRCITPAEHQLQYPDNEVTVNGCNEAWNGYVQYCVCQGDFCNAQNITRQQQTHHWVQKSTEPPPEEETLDLDDQSGPPAGVAAAVGQEQPATPRLPNGLLVPPSTRLPLSPPVATKLTGNPHGGSSTPNNTINTTPIIATKEAAPSPWDNNRIRHDGQHRSSPNENSSRNEQSKKMRGQNSARTLDESDSLYGSSPAVSQPGFLSVLALSGVSTILMILLN